MGVFFDSPCSLLISRPFSKKVTGRNSSTYGLRANCLCRQTAEIIVTDTIRATGNYNMCLVSGIIFRFVDEKSHLRLSDVTYRLSFLETGPLPLTSASPACVCRPLLAINSIVKLYRGNSVAKTHATRNIRRCVIIRSRSTAHDRTELTHVLSILFVPLQLLAANNAFDRISSSPLSTSVARDRKDPHCFSSVLFGFYQILGFVRFFV